VTVAGTTIAQFGRFRLDPHRRELLAGGAPVAIGSRALDVLIALIEARGELATKDELMSRVWPGTVVEEHNLHFQISTLRKALGPDRGFIKTISGRGYRFVAEIITLADHEEAASDPGAAPAVQCRDVLAPTNLPAPMSDLVGREVQLSEVADLVAAHRLVTQVGAGGIGKTRLGMEVGRRSLRKFADGVWLIELGPLSDPELVLPTIATVLGLAEAGTATLEGLAAALASRHLLLLLDNCEHVIDAVARTVEMLLRTSISLQVIGTSREPLRLEGECVYRVPPLDVPADDTENIEEVLQHSAVRLFIARARAAERDLSLDARTVAAMVTICRQLDGIPLAIELAAASAAALGVEGVASRLDNRFGLLADGRRTALARHQTLRATLDWSYELLPEPERMVMRRLSIFAGDFAIEAAARVAANGEVAASEVVHCLSNLVTKSLVASDTSSPTTRFRLLETTRAYGLEKLTESGEFDQAARRHAEYYRDLLERAAAELATRPQIEWVEDYGWPTDNVRTALDWAFSPSGDTSLGVALTAASVPLWMHLSLMEECRGRVEHALSSLASSEDRGRPHEMELYAALGASLIYTKGPAPETGAAWTNALEIAERLGDTECQLQALRGLWAYRLDNCEYRASLTLAQRFSSLAANQIASADLLVGERMIGTSLHFLADQSNARHHIERALSGYATSANRPRLNRYQFDQQVMARATLARILWLQGFPDQAMRSALTSVEEARASEHLLSLCNALVRAACPVALWIGDLATAERCIATLLDYSGRHGLAFWHLRGRGLKGMLMNKTGDVAAGLQLLGAALEELRQTPKYAGSYVAFLGTFAEALGGAGQVAEGLVAIDEALSRSDRTEAHWCVAELLRVKGELLLLEGGSGAAAAADDYFQQALDWSRQQGALSWELRAGTSLARQLRNQQRATEAITLLAPIYGRFTEGFETADLQEAKSLLEQSA
jgi:predicted ATPase/DNA-binding winged helix-turn-helix (wHTH) protein